MDDHCRISLLAVILGHSCGEFYQLQNQGLWLQINECVAAPWNHSSRTLFRRAEMIDEFIFPTEGWRRTADPFIPYYLLAAFFFAESEKLSQLSFVM